MLPKPRQAQILATPQTHGVSPRCTQTSGSERSGSNLRSCRSPLTIAIAVFKLPFELIIEILSHFGDPHRNILLSRGRCQAVVPEHVERLTVTRKLTMTCWHLRNKLFPLLWKYVEGCHRRYKSRPSYYMPNDGLYNQCVYLALNPTVGAYVQYVSSWIHPNDTHEMKPPQGAFCGI